MDINNNLSSTKTIGVTVSIVIFVISVQLESVQPVVAQVTCGRGTMLERYTHSCVPVPNGFEPCPSRTVYDSHNNSCYSYGVLCHGTKLLGVATPFYDPTTGKCSSDNPDVVPSYYPLGGFHKNGNTTSGGGGGKFVQPAQSGGQNQTK